MRFIYIIISLYLYTGMSGFLSAQNLKMDKLECLKIQLSDLPSGFLLYEESLAKPGSTMNEQDIQFWRRDVEKQELILINEDKHETSTAIGASSFQKWYRECKSDKKDKIEIDIVICSSDKEIKNTINIYTKETFANPFVITETPFAGEKSWLPIGIEQSSDAFSVMFLKSNVFVRLYLKIKDVNLNELEQITKKIAKLVEHKIDSIPSNEKD